MGRPLEVDRLQGLRILVLCLVLMMIGVYDPASRRFFLRNRNTAGLADTTIAFGPSGAIPVVGDWDGNGTVTIGAYDPGNQTFYLRNSNTVGFADITIRYGPSEATPLAGD